MDNSARRVAVLRNFFTRVLQVQERKQWKRKNLDANFRKSQLCNCSQIQSKWKGDEKEIWLSTWRSRQQSREEAKACGACLEPTELDVLLEEMSEREKLAESTRESCSSKSVETDRKKAEEKRCQALERIGETKRRANEEWKNSEKAAKKRSRCYRISTEKVRKGA